MLGSGRAELWRGDSPWLAENADLGPQSDPLDVLSRDEAGLIWSVRPTESRAGVLSRIDISWLTGNSNIGSHLNGTGRCGSCRSLAPSRLNGTNA
jgi:hypothetical protein